MPGNDGAAEVPLSGGNAAGEVVRRGNTVRKAWTPQAPRVHAYMAALAQRGIDLPRAAGPDERGRQVLEFVPGRLAIEAAPLDDTTIARVGALVRRVHDASAQLPVPDDWPVLLPSPTPPDLLCHNDLATWNLVADGDRMVFIDWDGAGPSTRLWDLAYAAIAFGHLFPEADGADHDLANKDLANDDEVAAAARRLAVFVDGYDADEDLRAALPTALEERARAMHSHLERAHAAGHQPWAAMYVEGHGEHWFATTRFIAEHQAAWRSAMRGPVPRRRPHLHPRVEEGADDTIPGPDDC